MIKNGIDIGEIVNLIVEDLDDISITNNLTSVISSVESERGKLFLTFNSGLKVYIKAGVDEYNVYVSSLDFYEEGDDPFKFYSIDRVKYYLTLISKEEGLKYTYKPQ